MLQKKGLFVLNGTEFYLKIEISQIKREKKTAF